MAEATSEAANETRVTSEASKAMDHELTHTMTLRIDEALREFTSRELVSGAEVVDFLLDLRLMMLAVEEPEPAAN